MLAAGQSIKAGDETDDVVNMLPKATRETPLMKTSTVRARFEAEGIELIFVPEDEVLLITLVSKKPGVRWPRGDAKPIDLRVGTTRAEVETWSGGMEFTRRPFDPRGRVRLLPGMGIRGDLQRRRPRRRDRGRDRGKPDGVMERCGQGLRFHVPMML